MSKLNLACLKWMVNMQRLHYAEGVALFSKNTPFEKDSQDAVLSAKEMIYKDSHTRGSFYWTKDQITVANHLGWNEWATTSNAKNGYNHWMD